MWEDKTRVVQRKDQESEHRKDWERAGLPRASAGRAKAQSLNKKMMIGYKDLP